MATGSITKFVAEDGRVSWRVRADGGTDPGTGKRRQRMKTFGTKKEAESWAREQQRMADRGEWGTAGKQTLGDWIAEWLDGAGSRGRRPSTLRIYDSLLKGRVVPALGHVPLAKLTPAALETFFRAQERELKPASVKIVYAVLRVCLADAERLGVLPANPLRRVKAPAAAKAARTAWSADDAHRFLVATEGHPDHPLYVLLLACGLRIGEGLALRWADVDLAGGRLVVARGKGGKRRTIPLAPALATALATALGGAARTSVHVLTLAQERQTGGAATTRYRAASHRLARLCARAGLPKRGLHALRHSAGTRLYEQSGDVELVSRLLGHESIATSTIYIKKSDTKLAKALEAWGD